MRGCLYWVVFGVMLGLGMICGGEVVARTRSEGDSGLGDSLKRALAGKTGVNRATVLWELTKYYADGLRDNERALSCVSEAYQLAQVAPVDSLLLVAMGRRKVAILRRMERNKEGLAILDYVLPIAKRNGFEEEVDLGESLAGGLHAYMGNYDKALYSNLLCARYRERVHDSLGLSITFHNLGQVYSALGLYDRALDYSLRSLVLKNRLASHYDEDNLCLNIAVYYVSKGDYGKAIDYIHKAELICEYSLCDEYRIRSCNVWGLMYVDREDYDSARYFLNTCDQGDGITSDNITRYQGERLRLLAKIANEQGNPTEAVTYLRRAESPLLRVHAKHMMLELYGQYVSAYTALLDYRAAVSYWDLTLVYSDSVFNEHIAALVAERQVDFEQEQNNAHLAMQETALAWQVKRNLWSVLLGGMMAVVVLVLLYDFWERRREAAGLEVEVGKRTRSLEDKVRGLEVRDMTFSSWEAKMDKEVREGQRRLVGLGWNVDGRINC